MIGNVFYYYTIFPINIAKIYLHSTKVGGKRKKETSFPKNANREIYETISQTSFYSFHFENDYFHSPNILSSNWNLTHNPHRSHLPSVHIYITSTILHRRYKNSTMESEVLYLYIHEWRSNGRRGCIWKRHTRTSQNRWLRLPPPLASPIFRSDISRTWILSTVSDRGRDERRVFGMRGRVSVATRVISWNGSISRVRLTLKWYAPGIQKGVEKRWCKDGEGRVCSFERRKNPGHLHVFSIRLRSSRYG